MSNSLVTKVFEGSEVRVHVDQAGQPWFNASDIAKALGYSDIKQAVNFHVDAEDLQKLETLTAGGRQLSRHVNEPGLYALIFGSDKPEAKRFKRWVTSEVLPAIRTTGEYVNEEIKEQLRLAQDRAHRLDRENFDMKMTISAGGADFATLRNLQNKITISIAESRHGLTCAAITRIALKEGRSESDTMDAIADLYNRFKIKQSATGEWVLAR